MYEKIRFFVFSKNSIFCFSKTFDILFFWKNSIFSIFEKHNFWNFRENSIFLISKNLGFLFFEITQFFPKKTHFFGIYEKVDFLQLQKNPTFCFFRKNSFICIFKFCLNRFNCYPNMHVPYQYKTSHTTHNCDSFSIICGSQNH